MVTLRRSLSFIFIIVIIQIVTVFTITESSNSNGSVEGNSILSQVFINNTAHLMVRWSMIERNSDDNINTPPPLYNDRLEWIEGYGEDISNNYQWNTTLYYGNPCYYGRTMEGNNTLFDVNNFSQPIDQIYKNVYVVKNEQFMTLQIIPGPYDYGKLFLCVNGTLLIKGNNTQPMMGSDNPKQPTRLYLNGIYIFQGGKLIIGNGVGLVLSNEMTPTFREQFNTLHQRLPAIVSFGGVIEINETRSYQYYQYFQAFYHTSILPIFDDIARRTTIYSIDPNNYHIKPIYPYYAVYPISFGYTSYTLPEENRVFFQMDMISIAGGSIDLLMGSKCTLKNVLFQFNQSTSALQNNLSNGINLIQGSSLIIDNSVFYLNESIQFNHTIRGLISVHHSKLNISSSYFNHQCQSIIIGEWGTELIYSYNNTFIGIPPTLTRFASSNNNNYLFSFFNTTMNGSAITTISSTSTTSINDRYYGSFPSSSIHIYQINNRQSITKLKYQLHICDLEYHHSNLINNNNCNNNQNNNNQSNPYIQHSIFKLSTPQQSTITIDQYAYKPSISQSITINNIEFKECLIFNPILSTNNSSNTNNIIKFNDCMIFINNLINSTGNTMIEFNHTIFNTPTNIQQQSTSQINRFKSNSNQQILNSTAKDDIYLAIKLFNNSDIQPKLSLQYYSQLFNNNNNIKYSVYWDRNIGYCKCIWNNTLLFGNSTTSTYYSMISNNTSSCNNQIPTTNITTNSISRVSMTINQFDNDLGDWIVQSTIQFNDIFIPGFNNTPNIIIDQQQINYNIIAGNNNNNSTIIKLNDDNNNLQSQFGYHQILIIFNITINDYQLQRYQSINNITNNHYHLEPVYIIIKLNDLNQTTSIITINQDEYLNSNNINSRIFQINTTIIFNNTLPNTNQQSNETTIEYFQTPNSLSNGNFLTIELDRIIINPQTSPTNGNNGNSESNEHETDFTHSSSPPLYNYYKLFYIINIFLIIIHIL